jgi:hypothetical protein
MVSSYGVTQSAGILKHSEGSILAEDTVVHTLIDLVSLACTIWHVKHITVYLQDLNSLTLNDT